MANLKSKSGRALMGGCVAGMLAGAMVLGGCSRNTTSASLYRQIRQDPTPELNTLTKTQVDIQNMMTVTLNENKRSRLEELHRILLLDRPSRLTRYPMPHP